MADILATALSGLNASKNRTLTAANNLSNANTSGFRSQRTSISTGVDGQGAVTDSVSTDRKQGSLIPTGNAFDLAIVGAGHFQVAEANGNMAYTRAGNFTPGPDGTLVNSSGLTLQPQVTVPDNATSVNIAEDGTVTAQLADGTSADLGQIQTADFSNPDGLSRDGGNLLSQTGASGAPQVGFPGTGGRGVIQSGFLESSNVDIVRESINLLNEENMTKANAAVVKTADYMTKSAIDLMA